MNLVIMEVGVGLLANRCTSMVPWELLCGNQCACVRACVHVCVCVHVGWGWEE